MSAVARLDAAQLNRACDCTTVDLPALQRRFVPTLGETHAHLFADAPVFVGAADVERMRQVVAAVEEVVALPAYRDAVLAQAPALARARQPAAGVFTGFDFHVGAAGPKLIEINTNAGGAFLNVAAHAAQRACCPADPATGARPDAAKLEGTIYSMFADEWRRARGDRPLGSVALVDEAPATQFLYPEFLLAQQMFEARGIAAHIADPAQLAVAGDRLLLGGMPIDLVYNRLTDFYLEDPRNAAVREACAHGLAVVTPHPHAHALYADKRNLVLLGDAGALRAFGASPGAREALGRGVPETRLVQGDADGWWRDRKDWFFKPRHGFGSRGAYRGDKLTRRVLGEIMAGGGYVAQRVVSPGERVRTAAGVRESFKVDVRCYTYRGRIQLMAARLYRGQTTNFRTAGGGFAPVRVVMSDTCTGEPATSA
jgi:hypothetical protein